MTQARYLGGGLLIALGLAAGACGSMAPAGSGVGGGSGAGGAGAGGAGAGTGGASGTGGVAGTGGSGSGGAAAGGRAGGSGGMGAGGAIGSGGAPAGAGGMVLGGSGGFGLGGPSRCSTAGVKLCESFENGLDSTVWTTSKSGANTVAVDGTHAARGAKALHLTTAADMGFAYIQETKSFPVGNDVLYGRMFVWFEDDITTDGHFTLAEGAGTGTAAVIRFGGQFKELGVGTDHGESGDWTDHDSVKIPSKTWMCVEFELKGDTHEFRVWWDDTERSMLRSGPSKHSGFVMPTFNKLWFGWWMYNMSEVQELWIDEIAVDDKPIGCAK